MHKKVSLFRQLVRISATLSVFAAAAIGAAALWLAYHFQAPGPLSHDMRLVIERGTPTKAIANQLHKAGVVEYPYVFVLYAKTVDTSRSLKAGEYEFKPSVSPKAVLDKLLAGDMVIRKITIPEGWTTQSIIAKLNETEGLSGTVPSGLKEGELFPETYHFMYNDTRESIIARMQKRMIEVLDEKWQARQKDLPFATKEKALTLASIVEKETGVAGERKHVAGVFINRLNKGMLLQSDPTVIYAVTLGKETLDRPLRKKDLKLESPYNTYTTKGLPPHPIANPGLASIEAVMQPIKTKDLYFVADGEGGHNFSSSLDGHNKNVKVLRKLEKEAKKKREKNGNNVN